MEYRLDVIVQYRARIAGYIALNAVFLYRYHDRGIGPQLQTGSMCSQRP